MSEQQNWKKLKAQGYRMISVGSGIAARVDREDWREAQNGRRAPVDADWYRRCMSKDRITVSREVAKKLGSSQHDEIGYVDKVDENIS